jgi:hypothetical protein
MIHASPAREIFSTTPSALGAGAIYFTLVFAAGFLLGAIRTRLMTPAIGELPAVALELPLMLIWSWIVCARLMLRFSIRRLSSRLTMGGLGFALLMAAEFATFVFVQGRSPVRWVTQFAPPAQFLGLAGQIAFALLPLIR